MKEKFACISGLVRVAKTAPSDRGLELVASSMWSTMTVTGVCFLAVLFAFLTVKVGRSIGSECALTSEPVSVSFLLSFSGLKYIHNHVRHHLFQTPLQPRRRFSSLKRSNSWIPVPGLFRRSSSASAQEVELLNSSNSPNVIFSRRSSLSNNNSTTTSNTTKRRSSIKRASLPTNVYTESSVNSSNGSDFTTAVSSTTVTATVASHTRSQSRRNTMPNIAVVPSTSNESRLEAEIKAPEPTPMETPPPKSMYMIVEEEEEFTGNDESSESSELAVSETALNDSSLSEANSEQLELALADLEAEASACESLEEEPTAPHTTPRRASPAIEITPSTTSSTGGSSFRSSYLNYLPESIFGYSTTSIFAKSPDAPPGFTKRSSDWPLGFTGIGGINTGSSSASTPSNPSTTITSSASSTSSISLSLSSSSSTASHNTTPSVEHQPLYARKPASSSERESRLSSLFSSTRRNTFSTLNASAPQFIPSDEAMTMGAPERAATASPRLEELQNTSDLFAPINWNYSQSEVWGSRSNSSDILRMSNNATSTANVDSLATGNNGLHQSTSSAANPERRKRAMSAYASSIFN